MASYLEIYCDKIISGEIVSCDKIKTICTKLKHDMPMHYFLPDIKMRIQSRQKRSFP